MDSSDLYVGAYVQAVVRVKKRTIILTLHSIVVRLLASLSLFL